MAKVNALLNERLNKPTKTKKMASLANESVNGNRNTFAGLFSVIDLSESEKNTIEAILHEYAVKQEMVDQDLQSLIAITSEVKAINTQAAILHGERIHKAHTILTNYQEGAFTSWLMATYGNRQTPYNFMQYYQFYQMIPQTLRPQLEMMPRQAIYTLASRDGEFEKKQMIVEKYQGETKSQLLSLIREEFPLVDGDKRRENLGEKAILGLEKVYNTLVSRNLRLTKKQKREISDLLEEIQGLIE